MTNGTDRLLIIDPLVHVAAYTGFVAAELTFYAFRLAFMADIALEL